MKNAILCVFFGFGRNKCFVFLLTSLGSRSGEGKIHTERRQGATSSTLLIESSGHVSSDGAANFSCSKLKIDFQTISRLSSEFDYAGKTPDSMERSQLS